MTWPPADTFRNRFLYGVAAGIGALVTVYFLLFALQTGAFLPWAIFTVALAATLVAGLGLVVMHAARAATATSDPGAQDAAGPDPAPTGPAPAGPAPADVAGDASRRRT